jgi:hypothetical protein
LKRRPPEQVSVEQADAEFENQYVATLRIAGIKKEKYPVGQVMYDVYAVDEGESADDLPANKLVGHLIPTSS